MVLGQADGPLLDRHLDRPDRAPRPCSSRRFSLAGAAEHERARIRRVGQEVVHRAIARARPAHAPLPDRPARQLLALGDQLDDDLARRPEPPPQHEDALDRVADLLVGGTARSGRPRRDRARPAGAARSSPRCGLVAQPAVQPRADQVQLGLGHRALQPEQQPVVEVAPANRPVRVGDQRRRSARTDPAADASPPSERASREISSARISPTCPSPTSATSSLNPSRPSLEAPERPGSSSTTTTDSGRPAQLDRSLAQRVLARARLRVALDLRQRRLAHIHDRAPATVRLGDLPSGHSSRSASTSRASSRASRTVTSQLALRRQRLPHRRRHHRLLAHRQRELSRHRPPPFSPEAPPRRGRRARSRASRSRNNRHAAGDATRPARGSGSTPPRQIRPARRDRPRRCHPPAGRRSAVSPSSVRHPSTSSSTPRSSPGAATSRTRSGNGSTT